ncbi:hypothetical protein WICMUC_001811 [Wickerhamomyces mucosus]|uniref:J domain-containing protein n=1 Tax=Wickerhamomyces mucosus TaxID=1378264 RepID=A0A9P8PT90_9ASCO|nr:hypothetical protein WICMUC_001811 [Wickerhamomyces mucosus]
MFKYSTNFNYLISYTQFKIIRTPIRIIPRNFASTIIDNNSNNDEPFHHSEWTLKSKPTPYEVFGIDPKEFDSKKLRERYFAFAKLYHPDISKNLNHIDHKGHSLTDINKSERFKMLSEAYTLLKTPRKRALYDKFQTGWSYQGHGSTFSGMNNYDPERYATRPVYATAENFNNQAYWNASSWEDYQNLRNSSTKKSEEELKQEKFKVLSAIFLVMCISASIQGWYILDSVEQNLLAKQRIHDDCEYELDLAYLNYGLDTSRISRIKRFLWFRTFGMFNSERSKMDQSAKENDALLKEILGEDYD